MAQNIFHSTNFPNREVILTGSNAQILSASLISASQNNIFHRRLFCAFYFDTMNIEQDEFIKIKFELKFFQFTKLKYLIESI